MQYSQLVLRWHVLAGLSLLVVLVLNVVGVNPTKSTIYFGLLFLMLTLIPIHFKKLARYRRDFGITSGVLIACHGLYAYATYLNLSPEKLVSPSILTGFVALCVLLVMLVTSNIQVQRRLSRYWRTIHAFVWFALPLSQGHAFFAARMYLDEVPAMGIMLLLGLGLFGIGKIFIPGGSTREHARDAVLVLLGVCVNILVVFLSPLGKMFGGSP